MSESNSGETNIIMPITNMIYISSLGTPAEINFARELMNLKKPDGVNVFQLNVITSPASGTTDDDDDQDI